MLRYTQVKMNLQKAPKVWLVTGVAGFIGSSLLEALLKLNQVVVGLDSFVTGHQSNLDDVKDSVTPAQWSNFSFVNADICDYRSCLEAVSGVDYVLHQAALGSVPRSIEDPLSTNASNISGFLNVLNAAKQEGVTGFVYAASSSTYGDHTSLPKTEENIGNPLSPYAVTKYVNELYSNVYKQLYGFNCVGLRYFNVFGPRQDPDGPYAAVIPKWIGRMMRGDEVVINGDGSTSRDFCYISNVVQANLLAATTEISIRRPVFNVAYGQQTTLLNLFNLIKAELAKSSVFYYNEPTFKDFRTGDVRHSLASIVRANNILDYLPNHDVEQGLTETIDWFLSKQAAQER